MPANTAQTKRFLGLNNVSDKLRLKFGWLQKADNVDITDTGAIVRRGGRAKSLNTAISNAFTTFDYTRMYIVSSGVLKQVNADMSTVTLKTGLSSRAMYWTEANDQAFYTNGVDAGIITKDGEVLPWMWTDPAMPGVVAVSGSLPPGVYQVACTFLLPDGRETGASDAAAIVLDGTQALQINNIPQVSGYATQVYIAPADSTVFQFAFSASTTSVSWNSSANELGMDLTTQFLDPLPFECGYLAFWRGQMYAAQYLPGPDSTVIWISEPLAFHLFDLNGSFIMVPGEVTMLAAQKLGLVIGTQTRIHVYDGEGMEEVADYGVVPRWSDTFDVDTGQVLFWSKRGMCTALPFSNVTQRQISVNCGLFAGAAIIRFNGAKRYVVALHQGGTSFNQRS